MDSLICSEERLVILNGQFLHHDDIEYQHILKHFTLPIHSRSLRPREYPSDVAQIFFHKTYDLFYQIEKREYIRRAFQETTKEQLENNLEQVFLNFTCLNKTENHNTISLIQSFFPPEIISRAKIEIDSKLYQDRVTFPCDLQRIKIAQKKTTLTKRIMKLRDQKNLSISKLSNKLKVSHNTIKRLVEENENQNIDYFENLIPFPPPVARIDALQQFKKLFPDFQEENLTIDQMFGEMKHVCPYFTSISRSYFYSNFIKRQGFVFVKPKITHSLFQKEKKNDCRILTTYLIYRIIESRQFLLFYDETTIQMTKTSYSTWFHRTEKKERAVRVTNTFLKLNLITSMNQIISFAITFGAFKGFSVSQLIISTCNHISEKQAKDKDIFVVLDNAPKNRLNMLKEQCTKGNFSLVYTTPTTPQHNFAESIFFFIKRKIDRRKFKIRGAYPKESKVDMAKSLFEVIASMNDETFANASRMYLHDLKGTLSGI